MKIIGTSEISFSIEKIISEADLYLVLISPFLKLHPRLKVILERKAMEVQHVFIAYREKENKEEEVAWVKNLHNVKLINLPNLHAKCYLSEDNALITSLNLYEYSQVNNLEIGVLLDPKRDQIAYMELLNEIVTILNSGVERIDLSPLIDHHSDFSLKKLHNDLQSKFSFPIEFYEEDGLYKFICSIAGKYHHFKDWELYQDRTGVLRTTVLPKEIFIMIKQEVSKKGIARSRPMN